MNLIRNGYLPLLLSEDTSARLSDEAGLRAGMFISVAPSKAFTAAERAALKSFVERGGIFLCTVGAEDAAPSAELLADFGLHVPSSPVPTGGGWPEPEPFGSTRALYLNVKVAENDAYQVAVRMHAAWPVESIDGQAEVIAYGHNQLRVVESDTELPVVIERRHGDGSVVLIGDTGFAMNKNLEYVGGEPFDGRYENANFWRWLITRLTDQSPWIPPREEASRAAATAKESE